MRELLLTRIPDIQIEEKSLTLEDLYNADEMFLTNVIRGIRWVKYLDEKRYSNTITLQLFDKFKAVVSEAFGEHLV